MRRVLVLFIILISSVAVWADSYGVLKPNQANSLQLNEPDEKILFILDYSASMTDKIGDKRKVDLMTDTMKQILPKISKNTWVGLRVYGHRFSITQMDACHASSTLVPISPGSSFMIQQKLEKTTPRGMTPITYSLKRALDADFVGFGGKKHIILLTDGGENCDESPCVWAMELIKVRKDVKIDVIAFNVNDKDALDQLQCTALVTTGKFYSARTAAELANSMRKSLGIKKEVDAVIIPNP